MWLIYLYLYLNKNFTSLHLFISISLFRYLIARVRNPPPLIMTDIVLIYCTCRPANDAGDCFRFEPEYTEEELAIMQAEKLAYFSNVRHVQSNKFSNQTRLFL